MKNSINSEKSILTPEAKKIMKLNQSVKERNLQRKKDLQNKDPFMSLGFGIIAYRSTLFQLAVAFFIMSIVMQPVIHAYHSGFAINIGSVDTKYGLYSIANLGYSSVQCQTTPFNFGSLVLTCPYGNITSIVEDNTGFGVAPVDSKHRDSCLRREEFGNVACSENLG